MEHDLVEIAKACTTSASVIITNERLTLAEFGMLPAKRSRLS
jgi:hypothetical protein